MGIIPKDLVAFPLAEYRNRVETIRAEMRRRDLDLLLLHGPENIYYATGYQTSGYFSYQVALITQSGDPILLVRYLERGNVDQYSWLQSAETWREGEDFVAMTADLIRSAVGSGKRVGVELNSWFLTIQQFEQLSALLPSTKFVDAGKLVDRLRVIKSPAEVAYIREAARICDLEAQAAYRSAQEGVNEAQIAAEIFHAGILAGCEYTGLPHLIQSGHRFHVAHSNWSGKVAKKGELILLETFGCRARYHATLMRTISIGPPNDQTRRNANIVLEALQAGLSELKPGASSVEVDAKVRNPIKKIRPDYHNRTGYSIGIGFPPKSAEWDALDFNEHHNWELKPGMVFHFLASAEGVGFSETVLITETGHELLTLDSPRDLQIC